MVTQGLRVPVDVQDLLQLITLPPVATLPQQITEDRLKTMLEQISERESTSKPKVVIQRRRPLFDEDD